MRNDDAVKDDHTAREAAAARVVRLPRKTTASTKQMHRRLLRSLNDRRIKRSFR